MTEMDRVPFYSHTEVRDLTRERFEPVAEPREDVIARAAPQTGSWAPVGGDLAAKVTRVLEDDTIPPGRYA